jgi:hypothetical protein
MALGTSNITMSAVNTELGSPYSPAQNMLLSVLSAHANAGNIASLYGPGVLAVDASKNVYWVTPTSNYKLGDFRGYDSSATAPSAAANFTHYWGPGGGSTNIVIVTNPQQMNLFYIDSNASRIYYKAYLSTTNRTNEASPHDTQLSTILTTSISPPTGHTRAGVTTKPQQPHNQTWTGFITSGLSTPLDYIYLDTFFANTGGTRLVNLGNAVSNGYTTITIRENQAPYAFASGNTSPPSGYTAAFPTIHTTNAKCTDSDPTYSTGGTGIDFYFGINGIGPSGTRHLGTSATTIRITYDGSTRDVNIGAIGSTKKYVSTTLPASKTWAYNKSAAITIVSKTYSGTVYTC